jgi:hypothetical protein
MAKCQICGKEYNYCPKCRNIGSWRAIVDTHECYQIAMILIEYREGIIDEIKASEHFEAIGIKANSDLSHLLDAVARDVKKIIAKGNEKRFNKKKYNFTK